MYHVIFRNVFCRLLISCWVLFVTKIWHFVLQRSAVFVQLSIIKIVQLWFFVHITHTGQQWIDCATAVFRCCLTSHLCGVTPDCARSPKRQFWDIWSRFFQASCPSCYPANSVQPLKETEASECNQWKSCTGRILCWSPNWIPRKGTHTIYGGCLMPDIIVMEVVYRQPEKRFHESYCMLIASL